MKKKQKKNTKNSTTFSNYIRNVPIEDDEIMVSFDVTSLYTNIPHIQTDGIAMGSPASSTTAEIYMVL